MKKTLGLLLLAFLAMPTFAADDVARLVDLMAKVGFACSPSFSPDGKTLAFVSNVSGLPQVWTVPAAGGYPELVDRLRRSGGWPSAGRRTANGSRFRSPPAAG